jgi:F0F1-type ATP synthase membrane subunit c/vacuolar-type H+-ATPase subunit K
MRTFGIALLVGAGGYVAGVLLGVLLVQLSSTRKSEKSMEAAMTGFFYVGPVVGLIAFVVALVML